jgi:hypothetical protein
MGVQPRILFITWLWHNGWRPGVYDFRHVNRLYRQMQKRMTGDWRFMCVTDDPAGIECETFPLWPMPEPVLPERLKGPKPNCYARLRLFDPGFNGQFNADVLVSIDLDTTVYRDLSPIITGDPFKIVRNERADTAKYCGTMWQVRPGAHPEVWRQYDPVLTPAITYDELGMHGSDQAWLSCMIPNAPVWGPSDGVFWNKRTRRDKLQDGARLVYFAGDTKPWDQNCRLIAPALYTPLL